MEELKPCPCCGGEADIEKQRVRRDGSDVKEAHIECTQCGIRGGTFKIERTEHRPGWWSKTIWDQGEYEKMVREWNRRVKTREKEKPVWKPQKDGIGVKKIEFAFCPRCGIMLNEMCVKGERMHEKYCKNCGVKINWEEDEGAGEPR